MITLGLDDSSGQTFPLDLEPVEGAGVSLDGAAAVTLDITGVEVLRNPFGQYLRVRLTFSAALPVGATLTLTIPTSETMIVTTTTERKEWCQRRDFRGRDLTRVTSTDSVVKIEDTRPSGSSGRYALE